MMPWRPEEKWGMMAGVYFAGAFIAFIVIYAFAPISDPDFWWHLKSGEVMVQNGGLLSFDPFTFSGDGVVSTREDLILKGYWLWQVTAYGLYALLGFNGIFLLNLVTVLAMAGVVLRQMHRQQVSYLLTMVLMTLGFYLLRATYQLERPQIVSFLLAAILAGLLARVREGGNLGWALPLLMMIWANVHGGFVVGDLILICFAAGVVIEYRHDLPRLRHLLVWVALGLGASLLNPNGPLAFSELFSFYNSAVMTGISEYQSTWVVFQKGSWFLAILWLLVALYGFGSWSARRLYWPELIVGLFLACFSIAYLRNVGFFAIAMLPAIGSSWQQMRKLQSKNALLFGVLIIIIAASLLLWRTSEDWQRRSNSGMISAFFPEESSRFILSSGIAGKMLNSYNFGGYQIWRLYPQHRVFIDGRGLDVDVYRDSKLLTAASLQDVDGRKEFEILLDRYGIDYVVLPHISRDTGRLTPLLKFLLIKPDWIPVYIDQQSYILVRNSQKNAAVIERYRLDKRDFNNRMVAYLTMLCKTEPAEVVNHVALAEMFIFVGRYAEAGERLAVIALLQPDNPDLPALRNQLEVLKNGKGQ